MHSMSATYGTRATDFGHHLQQFCAQAGIEAQRELGIAMGIRQQTVSRWEAGASRLRAKDMLRLAQVLSCTRRIWTA